jgi:CheY-like chemotaxis protein
MISSELREKLSKLKILIVDDEKEILESMEFLLSRYFREILFANDGKEAIEIYSEDIDIVIADVSMPRLNGIEMTQKLKEIDKDVKIIFVTGHNEDIYIEQFNQMKASYITKPVSKKILFKVLENFI